MTNPPFLQVVILTVLMWMGTACNPAEGVSYACFEEIPEEGWDTEDPITFEPFPSDSLSGASHKRILELSLRFSKRSVPAASLPMAVVYDLPDKTLRCDTLAIDVRNNMKRDYGISEVKVVLDSGFISQPDLCVTLVPLCNQQVTKGLINVGLLLMDSKPAS